MASPYTPPVQLLIDELGRLPGIGPRSAQRLALHLIKGDVHGSIEAIISNLNKIESDEVKLKIIHQGVGAITESDVTLSKATGAIILGFNVRPNAAAAMDAQKNKIDIRYYSIIYNLIEITFKEVVKNKKGPDARIKLNHSIISCSELVLRGSIESFSIPGISIVTIICSGFLCLLYLWTLSGLLPLLT